MISLFKVVDLLLEFDTVLPFAQVVLFDLFG